MFHYKLRSKRKKVTKNNIPKMASTKPVIFLWFNSPHPCKYFIVINITCFLDSFHVLIKKLSISIGIVNGSFDMRILNI